MCKLLRSPLFFVDFARKGFGEEFRVWTRTDKQKKILFNPQKLLKNNHYCKLCYGIVTGETSLPQTPLLLALIRAETSNLEKCSGSNIKGLEGISSIGKNMRTWIKLFCFVSEKKTQVLGETQWAYGAWRRSQRLKIEAVVGICWGHWQGMGCLPG